MDVDTGIFTLLFTDIEGSTEKWEQEPERMADALARHDVLLRTAVEAHRGRSRRPATGPRRRSVSLFRRRCCYARTK